MFTLEEVNRHNTRNDCWVIINNLVYDVADFLDEHPGGSSIILKYAGRDATAVYEPIHPSDALIKHLSPDKHLGPLDRDAALTVTTERAQRKQTSDEARVLKAHAKKPLLSRILSLQDMEVVARNVLSYRALTYYASSSDDEITGMENARAFTRFFFHARVMRPVSACDPSTTILGFKSAIPVFVSGAALAKLGHPQGELNITKAAHKTNIIQMVSSNASFSPSEIMEAAEPSQPLFFQLYKHTDDALALKRVREVEVLGYKAIFLTVDAIVAGNREADIRSPWVEEQAERKSEGKPILLHHDSESDGLEEDGNIQLGGTAGALVKNDDRDMTFQKTIPWLRSVTSLPIVIKGIQCVEDAVLAAEAGVDGILISNHGGRQLEYSMPSIEVLYRLHRQRPDVFAKIEVYVDGGVRRGTDVVKAICLGATAVGLGRPFLYAQSAYGAAGVVKTVRILEREIMTAMRLLGAASINDLKPEMVERVDWQPVPHGKL